MAAVFYFHDRDPQLCTATCHFEQGALNLFDRKGLNTGQASTTQEEKTIIAVVSGMTGTGNYGYLCYSDDLDSILEPNPRHVTILAGTRAFMFVISSMTSTGTTARTTTTTVWN